MENELSSEKWFEFAAKFRMFIEKKHKKDMAKAIERDSTIEIDFSQLDIFSPEMANLLLDNPDCFFDIASEAMNAITPDYEIKARFFNSPLSLKIRNIRSKHIGKLITIEGFVRKASDVKPEIVERVFQCRSCLEIIKIPSKNATNNMKCRCGGSLRQGDHEKIDVRWITVEESFEATEGEKPSQLNCFLCENLVLPANRRDSEVGNRIRITGVLREIPKEKASLKLDFYLEAIHIMPMETGWEHLEMTKEDEEKIKELAAKDEVYEILIDSFAPSLYGLRDIKEAVILQFFGGVQRTMPDENHIRGDIHLLIIGDASTGKSQILKIASEISPRSRYVSGKGSTTAGLCATVTKDELLTGGWVLEAGALVLCNKGLLCVDEFEKMTPEDQTAFHEAMEQQCYDTETEVLTEDGWKYFKDVTKNDKIATLSKQGMLEYQKPTQLIESPYDGDMYKFKSRKVDLLVTPNHNMLVNVNKRANEWHGFGLQRADNLFREGNRLKRMRFKRNAIWIGKERKHFYLPRIIKHKNQNKSVVLPLKKYSMNDWLEFFGYFLAEGSVRYQNGIPYVVTISQTKSKEKISKINDCLKSLEFKYNFDGYNFNIYNKQLATYFSALGKQRVRYMPKEYKSLPKQQLKIMFDAMMLGDGYTRITNNGDAKQCGYITSSKTLADDVQEIILKIGHSATIQSRFPKSSIIRGRKVTPNGLIYNVSINGMTQEPNINTNRQKHIAKTNYKGMVYCVEVPNHILYVRRNGYPVWCGNTVSVSKATITATLPARTAILAGGNPKLSRFDDYIPISKQINIPDTLLSRFDLKFVLKDKPNAENDRKLLKHVLSARRKGEETKPKLTPNFIRKYVSYAKEHCSPEMTEEAEDMLMDFYLKMRKMYEEKEKSIAITLRQFEALIRLAEASAKIQLSQTVRVKDAERAIRIMNESLLQLGYDPETKKFDADRLDGNVSASERKKIMILMDIINEMAVESKEIRTEDLKKKANLYGLKRFDEALDNLKLQGLVYMINPVTLKKV